MILWEKKASKHMKRNWSNEVLDFFNSRALWQWIRHFTELPYNKSICFFPQERIRAAEWRIPWRTRCRFYWLGIYRVSIVHWNVIQQFCHFYMNDFMVVRNSSWCFSVTRIYWLSHPKSVHNVTKKTKANQHLM